MKILSGMIRIAPTNKVSAMIKCEHCGHRHQGQIWVAEAASNFDTPNGLRTQPNGDIMCDSGDKPYGVLQIEEDLAALSSRYDYHTFVLQWFDHSGVTFHQWVYKGGQRLRHQISDLKSAIEGLEGINL